MRIKRLKVLCFVPMFLILAGCTDNKDCDNPSMILPGEAFEKRLAEFERRCPDQAKASAQLREGTFKKSEPKEW